MKCKFLLLLTIICLSATLQAQTLPRRAYLGIRMENLTDDIREVKKVPSGQGVLIAEVLPQSTAEKAGFKAGDVLLQMGNETIRSTGDVLDGLAKLSAGENFRYTLIRSGKSTSSKAVLYEFPREQYPDIQVSYTESNSAIGMQRIILSSPKTTGKHPLIVFIGGIGCYSLDMPLDTTRNEIQLLNFLVRSGYACARIEKPGMGDNAKYCKSCAEVSFSEETAGYVEAVKKLKSDPTIDTSSVVIIGHSMGGVFAPLIARETSVKGIIAYGTIGSNFIEYLAKTRRTIAEAYGMNPVETDDLIKEFCACSSLYYVDKMTTEQAAKKMPVCQEYLSIFDLRSRAYNDELYAFNLPDLWRTYKGYAHFIWGKSDYISSEDDHQILEKTVNHYHPDHATFTAVNHSDHAMSTAASFSEARNSNVNNFNREVGTLMLNWINALP